MKISIPIFDKNVVCSELTVKHYKDLLKVTFGEELNTEGTARTVLDVLQVLMEDYEKQIKELSVIEIIMVLLRVRSVSMGNLIELNVSRDSVKMSLQFNLNNAYDQLLEKFAQFHDVWIGEEQVQLLLDFPTIHRLFDQTVDQQEHLSFIKKIRIKKDETYSEINITTKAEANLLLEKLSPKFSLLVMEHFDKVNAFCSETNFLTPYQITEQRLVVFPVLDSLAFIAKLLFNESLSSFYDNMFYLAYTGRMNLQYIDSLTPGEYMYMLKKLEFIIKEQNKSNQQQNQQQDFSGEGVSYFGDEAVDE